MLALKTSLEFHGFSFFATLFSHVARRVSLDSSRLSRDKPASYFRMQIFIDIIGFRLASYRSVGVSCEAPYLRSISQIFLDGFSPLLISMHLHVHPFKVGLCHGIHNGLCHGIQDRSRFPLLPRRRVSDETRHANNLHKTPLFSELSGSQKSGNHQDKVTISVSKYTRLGRPALQ